MIVLPRPHLRSFGTSKPLSGTWRPWLALALCLASLAPRIAHAEIPQELRGARVVDVRVASSGTSSVGQGTTERAVGIPVGARLSRRLLRGATLRMLESGRYADVAFDLIPAPGGVRLVVHVEPRIVLSRVDLRPAGALDREELASLVGTRAGELLDRAKLTRARDAVQRALVERGYDDAQVELLLRDTDDPTQKALVVNLEPGRRTHVAALHTQGDPLPPVRRLMHGLYLDSGDVLDRRRLEDDVRELQARLWRGGWLEARVTLARVDREADAATLTLESHVGPKYEVRVRGQAPLDRDDVLEALHMGEERVTAPGVLDGMRQRVRETYAKLGFHDADAQVDRVRGRRSSEAFLLVRVLPGTRVKVVGTSFPGARHFDSATLLEQVESYLDEDLSATTITEPVDAETARLLVESTTPRIRETPPPFRVVPHEVFYEPTYERATAHLQELYRAEGYLSAVVGPARLDALSADRAVAVVPIVEGPRSMLHAVEILGNQAMGARELLEAAGLRRDMPFSHLALEQARSRIIDLYQESGYLFAQFEPEVRFSGDRTRVDVILRVVERFVVHVDDVRVEGADRTSSALILSLSTLHQGDVYRPSRARETEDALLALGIFTGVNVGPEDPELAARNKSVVIRVTERKTQFLDFHLGLSTGEGVRAGFEYGYRNLFGYAIGFNLRVRFAYQFFVLQDATLQRRLKSLPLSDQLERHVSLGFTFPFVGLPHVRSSLTATHQRDNERDFGFTKNGLELAFIYTPVRELSSTFSSGIESNDIGLFPEVSESLSQLLLTTTDTRLRQLLLVPEGRTTLVTLAGGIHLDLRDNPFTPHRGYLFDVGGEWARTLRTQGVNIGGMREEFFSDQLKLTAGVRAYAPLGHDVVFAAQLRVGRIVHLSSSSETYPNRLFFMGGVDTLRGYLEDEMVPQDLADQIARSADLTVGDIVRGGDAFFLIRSELRFPIYKDVAGGVFADLGNLWARAQNFNPFDLRPTAGIGLRIATPIGPLAFDYGFVLLRRKAINEGFGAFHFSIGLF